MKKAVLMVLISITVAFMQCQKTNSGETQKAGTSVSRKPEIQTSYSNVEPATRFCLTDEGYPMGGYDPVSFLGSELKEGNPEFLVNYQGAKFIFSSSDNAREFEKDPERFLPAYGGWCAVCIAMGKKHVPNFDNFKLENGKILFFETTVFTNGRVLWDADPEKNRKNANQNYENLVNKGSF